MSRRNDLLKPEITVFGKCHTCQETIPFGIANCPHCGIEIDQDAVFPGAFNYFVITQAISAANNLRTMDVAVVIFIGVALVRFFSAHSLWFDLITTLPWMGVLAGVMRWFRLHGRWDSKDQEYLAAQTHMKWSLKFWAAANAFNLIVLLAVHLR